MITPTNVVFMRDVIETARLPIDRRTVAQDRELHRAISAIGRMTHIVRVNDTKDDHVMADAERVAMSPAQRAFLKNVLPECIHNDSLVNIMPRLFEAVELPIDCVVGEARGWD